MILSARAINVLFATSLVGLLACGDPNIPATDAGCDGDAAADADADPTCGAITGGVGGGIGVGASASSGNGGGSGIDCSAEAITFKASVTGSTSQTIDESVPKGGSNGFSLNGGVGMLQPFAITAVKGGSWSVQLFAVDLKGEPKEGTHALSNASNYVAPGGVDQYIGLSGSLTLTSVRGCPEAAPIGWYVAGTFNLEAETEDNPPKSVSITSGTFSGGYIGKGF